MSSTLLARTGARELKYYVARAWLMNRWKIFGYTIITWLVFSVLAKLYTIVMQQQYPGYSMIDGQSVIWSWMSLFMGIVMTARLKKWIELLWGALVFFVALFPFVGFIVGIAYFAWCYVKLEKRKLSEESSGC